MAGVHHNKPETYEKTHETNGYDSSQQHDATQFNEGADIHGIEYKDGTRLHRGLKARQITMIAIGKELRQPHTI